MQSEKTKTCKVMLVGAGQISNCYLDYCKIDRRVEIIAAADPNETILDNIRKKHSLMNVTKDYKELLKDPSIDIVIVCTPHNLHFPVVMDALKSGKHVICEKPIAVSTKEADEMIDFAQKCSKNLLITLNSRFTARTFKIKELLEQKALGKIFMGHAAYLGYEFDRMADASHWKGDLIKAGGGVLLDGGYHMVDLMNLFFGKAKSVQACGGRFVVEAENKGEDNIIVQVEYENGAIADIQVSFTACNAGCLKEPTLMLDIDIYGTDGSIRYNYNWDTIEPIEKLELLKPQNARQIIDLRNIKYDNCYCHFFDCIINDEIPIATALDARNAMAVVEAAYESMKNGKKVNVDWR